MTLHNLLTQPKGGQRSNLRNTQWSLLALRRIQPQVSWKSLQLDCLYVSDITEHSGVLSRQKLSDLVSEIDPKQVLDEDVEDVRFKTAPILLSFTTVLFASFYYRWRMIS